MQRDKGTEKAEQPEWKLIKRSGFVPDPWVVREKLRDLTPAQQLIGQVIVDKTIGWINGEGPERKLIDYISVSQFVEGTKLSKRAVYDNLEAVLNTGMFIRERSDNRRRSKWRYGLNFEWLEKEVLRLEAGRLVGRKDSSDQDDDVKGEVSSPLRAERGKPTSPLGVNELHPQKKPLKEINRKKEARKRAPPDPRLKHPASKGYRRITHLTLQKAVRDDWTKCAEDVGTEKLLAVVELWMRRGWDPKNTDGMMDRAMNEHKSRKHKKRGKIDEPTGQYAKEVRSRTVRSGAA